TSDTNEGEYEVEFRTSDYCGQCASTYNGDHDYDESNILFQSVIEQDPGCCAFWGSDCEALMELSYCGLLNEPNDSFEEAFSSEFFGPTATSVRYDGSIQDLQDLDFYGFDIMSPGTMYVNVFCSEPNLDLATCIYQNLIPTSIACSSQPGSFQSLILNVLPGEEGSYHVEVKGQPSMDLSLNTCYELSLDWVPEDFSTPPCTLNVELEDETDCDPSSNTFSVEVEVTTTNPGGITWVINGQEFPINAEIEFHTLTNLPSVGGQMNLQIQVKENPECNAFYENFVNVPEPCAAQVETCLMDGNGDLVINAADLLVFLGVFGSTCE
ncbi:MAG: hypothetical protein AAF193_00300, partial [Bacteroidota bacterium]